MQQFDVALWRYWPSLWPDWFGVVEADNAFSAVIQLMHVYGLQHIARGTALAKDGSLRYRCIGLTGVDRGLVWFSGRGSRSARKKV